MSGIITVTVVDTLPTQASSTPPDPVGLTAIAQVRGVRFEWSPGVWIRPYHWQFAISMSGGAYGAWIDALFSGWTESLTDAEALADPSQNIAITVRSTDGRGNFSAEVPANANCLFLNVDPADIPPTSLLLGSLAEEITTKMFASTDRDAADLKNASILLAKLGANVTPLMFAAVGRIANDVVDVNGVAAATVSAGAAGGLLANTKLTADGVETGGDTIESTVGSAAKIDARLSAVEKTALETALGVAVALLAGDTILITGANENLVANKVAIKTGLALENTPNLSAANIIATLNEAAIQAGDGVTNGAATNLAAAINTLAGVITKATMLNVAAEIIEDFTTGTKLFDNNGNITFGGLVGVGIKSGVNTRTPANIIASMDASGNSLLCDITSLKAGQDFDDFPNGTTYKKCTANEQLGAQYAKIGLSAAGKQTIGTTNKTVAQIENQISARKTLFQHFKETAGFTAFDTITFASGVGTLYQETLAIPFIFQTGMTTLRWSSRYQVDAGTGNVRIVLYDINGAGVALRTGVAEAIVAIGVYGALQECSLDITTLGLINDTRYVAMIDIESTNPNTTTMEEAGILEVDFS